MYMYNEMNVQCKCMQILTTCTHIHVDMYMGVLCCFALFVCLTLLASFFLPSHLSFKNMCVAGSFAVVMSLLPCLETYVFFSEK